MTVKKLLEKEYIAEFKHGLYFLTWNGSRCAQSNVSLLNSIPSGIFFSFGGREGSWHEALFSDNQAALFFIGHDKLILGHTLIMNKGLSYRPRVWILSQLRLVF